MATQDRKRFTPLGQLYPMGGHRLHRHSMGPEAGPTVILESGLGMPAMGWIPVQREVAKFARVRSYDRAGYSWSDSPSTKRNGLIITQDLHELLQQAGLPGPGGRDGAGPRPP